MHYCLKKKPLIRGTAVHNWTHAQGARSLSEFLHSSFIYYGRPM